MEEFREFIRCVAEQYENVLPRAEEPPPTENADKFAEDIKALSAHFPLEENCEIIISLQELLNLCPRTRRRTDAYRSLQSELGRRGVLLTIKNNREI